MCSTNTGAHFLFRLAQINEWRVQKCNRQFEHACGVLPSSTPAPRNAGQEIS